MGLMNTSKKRIAYSRVGCFLFVLCINLFFLLVFRSLNELILKDQDLQTTMLCFVFIPLSCFVSGFFAYLVTGKFIINSVSSILTGFFSYIAFIGPDITAFLWVLLYYFNALMGYAIAFIAVEFYGACYE